MVFIMLAHVPVAENVSCSCEGLSPWGVINIQSDAKLCTGQPQLPGTCLYERVSFPASLEDCHCGDTDTVEVEYLALATWGPVLDSNDCIECFEMTNGVGCIDGGQHCTM